MNTKAIGNIGEAKTLSKFIELNIPVYLPFGDNEKVDMLAFFNGKYNRIQVKTAIGNNKNGSVTFDLTSSTSHRKNGIKHVYDESEIDYFACYSVFYDVVCLIPINIAPNKGITIRYANFGRQKKRINFSDDFLPEKILCVETLHGTPKSF